MQKLTGGRTFFPGKILTDEELKYVVQKVPRYTTFLVCTKVDAIRINKIIISDRFQANEFLGTCFVDELFIEFDVFKGQRMIITRNINKDIGFVNGMFCEIVDCRNRVYFVKLNNEQILAIHCIKDEQSGMTVFPFMPAYCLTGFKAQGQTLESVCIFFNDAHVQKGQGYVMISRVKRLPDLYFCGRVTRDCFKGPLQ